MKTALCLAMLLLVTAPADEFKASIQTDILDAVARVRQGNFGGTASCIYEDDEFYWFITNHHVAGRQGTRNSLEIFNYGRALKPIATVTIRSWFSRGLGKDLALLRVRKTSLPGPLPVIPIAESQDHDPREGDTIVICGCPAGIHPSASFGHIVRVRDGLIFYLSTSVGGNSGGPIYNENQDYQIGVTAWKTVIQIDGRPVEVGLAMSGQLVQDILYGRVAADSIPKLPDGATEIVELISKAPKLPTSAEVIPHEINSAATRHSYDDEKPQETMQQPGGT